MKNTKDKIIPNWWKVFFTWSFAFHALSVVLTFVDQLLPFFGILQSVMTTEHYATSMFVLNGLGLLSRFIKQKSLWEYHPNDMEVENATVVADKGTGSYSSEPTNSSSG